MWVGVDVGGKRKGFDVAVIDDRRVLVLQGHLTCSQVADLAREHRPAVVAVDSPCCCAPDGQTARAGELQIARSVIECGPAKRPGDLSWDSLTPDKIAIPVLAQISRLRQ